MDSAELLAQLADIHMPEPVSFWPPAPGWWVLGALLLATAIFITLKTVQAVRQRRICSFALQELERCYALYRQNLSGDANQARLLFVNQLNSVLRRVALWHFPNAGIASLGGRAWVDFIKEKGDASSITDDIAEALGQGRFKTRCDVDAEALNAFGRHWITALYMKKQTHSSTNGLRA
ncbi:MAG: hypothetical protein RLZZ385_2311 [Pseudomonadota bacterium]|jgi:hypothetical protein